MATFLEVLEKVPILVTGSAFVEAFDLPQARAVGKTDLEPQDREKMIDVIPSMD